MSLLTSLLLVLVGHYHLSREARITAESLAELNPDEVITPYDAKIRKALREGFDPAKIRRNLAALTQKPHLAGTDNNLNVANYIAKSFQENGLRNVHFAEYEGVLLSYPDFKNPNTVKLYDESSGKAIFLSDGISKPLIPAEQDDPSAWVKFNAYSGSGSVTGQPVYCNYGTKEDFEYLKQSHIELEGAIAIIRYGATFRGDKIWEAELRNMSAVILYTDPADQAREGTASSDTYPHSEWMPPGGAQRGTLMRTNGDPLTPSYPAKNYTFRSENIASLRGSGKIPSIPVVPMSYGDAYSLLRYLKGKPAPSHWQGGLNFTYRIGPGYSNPNFTVELNVTSKLLRKKIQNVIGYIRGSRQPDQYVIVGNHYDAWTYGSIDPNSGTAVLLELSRVLMKAYNYDGWSPERTIVFCAWDAEEYGLVGSTEWVEEHLEILKQRAVAYVNVDLIPGNFTLMVETTPSLYRLAVSAAKSVPNPREDETKKGRKTVYDTWIRTRPNGTSWDDSIPAMHLPEDGSDHAAFIKLAGVPILNFRYENSTLNPGASYPLYHTLYETKFLPEKLMDSSNLAIHVAVGRYWAEVVRLLTDSTPVPFNVTDLALYLLDSSDKMLARLDAAKVPKSVISQFELFRDSLKRLYIISVPFHASIDKERETLLEGLFLGGGLLEAGNLRLIHFQRCFISRSGPLPGQKSEWRNILWGTDPLNQYMGSEFPGIYGALAEFTTEKPGPDNLLQQFSIAQYAIECVTLSLQDEI